MIIQKLFFSIISLLRILKHTKIPKHFYNVNLRTKECYILANGPSLKNDLEPDEEKIKKSDIIVFNDFAQSNFFQRLNPKYYIFADPLYWSDKEQDILQYQKVIFNLILNDTYWEMNILIPIAVYKKKLFHNTFKNNNNIKIKFYNPLEFSGFDRLKSYFFFRGLTMPKVQNVLIAAISTSIVIGYSEVHLLGVGHSWTQNLVVDNNNQVCIRHNHFYDLEEPKLTPWLKVDGENYKMHEILSDLAFMFSGYFELKHFANLKSIRIVNHTQNSFIDAFEKKINYEPD